MIIAAQYSFNNGKEEVARHFADLLPEVNAAIQSIDAEQHKVRESKEKRKWDSFFTAQSPLTMLLRLNLPHPVGKLCE